MVNKWVILPLIMHVLFARQNNQTLEETAASDTVQNLVKYLLRHHVHNFGVQALLGHHIMSYGYDLNMTENLASSASYAILAASIFISETINAALSNVVITGSETLEERKKTSPGRNRNGCQHVLHHDQLLRLRRASYHP